MQDHVTRPLAVLTWNISYEPLQPPGVLGWNQRRDRMAETVRDADIIALQELSGHQFSDMQQRLAAFDVVTMRTALPAELHQTLSARYGAPLEREFGELALFVRTERLEVMEQHHQWLSPTPAVPLSIGWGNAVPRLLLWCLLRDRGLGALVVVAATHVDLRAVQPMLAAIRDALAESVARVGAGILVGDLNTMADPGAFGSLLDAGWRDTHASHDLADDPTFLGELAGRPGRVDHILVHGHAVADGWRRASAKRDSLSDHLAVRAEVRLRPAGDRQEFDDRG